jgi:hypothetical protein
MRLLWIISALTLLSSNLYAYTKGKVYKLTILHTNDHHGRFWPNKDGEWGLAARATLINQLREQVKADGGHSLLIDAGDINTGVPQSDLQDAEPDFRGMALLGYDVCHLTYNMIQGNQVIYERMKFPKIGKPLLIEKSKQIIEKHEGQGIDNYVFPVFTKKHTTEAKMRNRVIQISNRVSKTLTKVCNILDIKENITWYSARGTFISRMVDA